MGKAACMQLPFYVCISRHIQMPSLKKDIWRALGLFYMRRNKKIIVILHIKYYLTTIYHETLA